jgi:hypothetical protein
MGKLCDRGQAMWPWISCIPLASCVAVASCAAAGKLCGCHSGPPQRNDDLRP